MIVLAVLFGTVLSGAAAVALLTVRARRQARVLSEVVARASGEYRASSADLRQRVSRGGAET